MIGGINNDQNNRGWWLEYHIPYTSLGLFGPPPQGTIWGLALALHDRDSGTGPMNPDTLWPESFSPAQPVSWGEMRFGLPTYTQPIPVIQSGVSVIRNKLNGVIVKDVAVGGQFNCGADAYTPDGYFANWGNLRYADDPYFNVQNQGDMSDWPCFSKVFITFPLTSVPASKVIVSATLTLYHMGNPGVGWEPGPVPSYIQLLTIDHDWDENTLTWNTAPPARENLGGIWVTPILETPPYPGIPYTWDVSRAVAEAYAAGEPLRLAIYSADEAYHSGRYFYSSDVEDLNATGRPTLNIGWGTLAPSIQASVDPVGVNNGGVVTYTLALLGSGNSMTLTDQLPAQLSAPHWLTANSGSVAYSSQPHRVEWHGTLTVGAPATITFAVDVLAPTRQAIVNTVVLTDTVAGTTSSTVTLIVNPLQIYLPLIRR